MTTVLPTINPTTINNRLHIVTQALCTNTYVRSVIHVNSLVHIVNALVADQRFTAEKFPMQVVKYE